MPLTRLSEATCRDELENNLLPFWMIEMADIQHGGLLSRMSASGTPLSGEKFVAMHAAVLYIFSASSYRLGGDAKSIFATQLYEYLVGHCWDEEFSGVHWSLDKLGNPKCKDKDLKAQALALLGFCSYFRMSEDSQALLLAKETYDLIENKYCNSYLGTYAERFDQTWTFMDPPSSYPKMASKAEVALLCAYVALYKLWPDSKLRLRILQLCHNIIQHIHPQGKPSNTYVNGFGHLEYHSSALGHDAEASWLLYEAASTLQNTELLTLSEHLSGETAHLIINAQDSTGGISDLPPATGERCPLKSSWTQAHGMIALVNHWIITGDDYYRHRAEKVWEFIQTYLRDEAAGGWYAAATQSPGKMTCDQDRVGNENFGHQSALAMLELLDRFAIAHTQAK
ncbi:MAG: AGE family epimerase/isomerase [Bacteroidota bacterium]